MTKVSLISLGCTKNLVDSEVVLGKTLEAGAEFVHTPQEADIVIINTCAFIESARQEAMDTIRSVVAMKEKGLISGIVVAGCLPKYFRDRICVDDDGCDAKFIEQNLYDQIDAFIGPGEIEDIKNVINTIGDNKYQLAGISERPSYIYDHQTPRMLATPAHTAYVKIAEGCSNRCSYCLIPSIRGEYRSRKIESIVTEAENLVLNGVKEINLIAQDSTYYGSDIYGKAGVAGLLERLNEISGLRWIRLLYTHPDHIDGDLLKAVNDLPKVCRYIDMPLQHIDDDILKSMNRKASSKKIRQLIEEVRERIPGVTLRTSIIVGLPGETDEKFRTLLDFVKEIRFDRLGAFAYSREEGTKASLMSGQIESDIKNKRLSRIMSAQQTISKEINRQLVGKEILVLLDNARDENVFVGRAEGDAPDVDCSVIVKGKDLKPGDFVKARVTKAYEYDIEARVLGKGKK